MGTQYIHLIGGSPKYLVFFFAIANYPVFIIFGFIITYHILLSTKQLCKAHYLYKKVEACFVNKEQQHYRHECSESGDYTQAREPLLEAT